MSMELKERLGHTHICDLSCPVEHVMRGAPVVDPEYTLRMTAQAMTVVKAGAAIICDPRGSTIVVTERDIIHALSDAADPDKARVAEVAFADLGALVCTATIFDAVQHLSKEGSRHVPVKCEGNVVGLITAEDLFGVLNSKRPGLTRA